MMNTETSIDLSQTNHQDIISYITAFQAHTLNGFCDAEKVKDIYRYEDVLLLYLCEQQSVQYSLSLSDRQISLSRFVEFTKVIFSDDLTKKKILLFDILSFQRDHIIQSNGETFTKDEFLYYCEHHVRDETINETFTNIKNQTKQQKSWARKRSGQHRWFACLLFILWCMVLFAIRGIPFFQDGEILLGIAKGSGFIIKVNITLVFLLVNKVFLNMIQKMSDRVYDGLQLEKYKLLHVMTGVSITLAAVVHIIAHLSRGNSFTYLIQITGYVAFFCLILLSSAIHILKSRYAYLFSYVHLVSFLFLGLTVVHVYTQYLWFVPLCVILLFTNIYSMNRGRLTTIIDKSQTKVHEQYCQLTVHKTHMNVQAGQYFLVSVPGISRLVSKPFTAMESLTDDNFIQFRIRKIGHWTSALYNQINTSNHGFQVILKGPYGKPVNVGVRSYKRLFFVSSGIGLTPSVAYLIEYVKQLKDSIHPCSNCETPNCHMKSMKEIWVLWSLPDIQWIKSLDDLWEQMSLLNAPNQIFKIYIHISKTKPSIQNFIQRAESTIDCNGVFRNYRNSSVFSIRFGRANYLDYIREFHEQGQAEDTSKIHFCTNRTILTPCKQFCKEKNIPYTYEHFEL